MKNDSSLIVSISGNKDIDNITKDTKYINLDITNPNYDVISYFIKNGENYLYTDMINNISGYNYVTYDEFVNAENIINMIYAKMPNNLHKLEIAKYLYIMISKTVSYDINLDNTKNDQFNLSFISNINNLWGSLSKGIVNQNSIVKIYYYMCRRLDIDANIIINESIPVIKLKINNQILLLDIFKDIPYIQANMRTRYFATYNDDIKLDKSIKYCKTHYNDDIIDKSLKNIDYMKENCLWQVLNKTQKVINIDLIKPLELSIIYKDIFDKYCPNYHIKINNLFLYDKYKKHFIMISDSINHYSYNYKQKTFIKVDEKDILDNINIGKIGLYNDEDIPNISNYIECININC